MPRQSAPRATASRASCSRSRPWSSRTVSTPSCAARSTSPKRSTFPPPDHGLQSSTAWRGGPAARTRTSRRSTVVRHGGARRREHHREHDDHDDDPQRDAIRAVERPGDRHDDGDEADGDAGDAERPSRHRLGDDPPSAGGRDAEPEERRCTRSSAWSNRDADEDQDEHDEDCRGSRARPCAAGSTPSPWIGRSLLAPPRSPRARVDARVEVVGVERLEEAVPLDEVLETCAHLDERHVYARRR